MLETHGLYRAIFLEVRVAEGKKPGTFFQFSVTDKDRAKSKIRQTIEALKKVGREPKQLVYATNELLPKQDILREDVFDDYQVLLIVKDAERLKQIVNSEPRANKVFLEFFAADITSVKHSAENLRGSVNQFVKDPTVFAFLDYELKDRFAKDHLQDCILDSLIYWALRETDPDAEKFMSRGETVGSAIVHPTQRNEISTDLRCEEYFRQHLEPFPRKVRDEIFEQFVAY